MGAAMILRRASRKRNFSIIDNTIINDVRLRGLSRAVLIYILSKPDNWQIRKGDLFKQFPDSKNAIQIALRELRKCGYAALKPLKDSSGHLCGQEYIFSDLAVDIQSSEDGTSPTSEISETRKNLDTNKNGTRSYKEKDTEGKDRAPEGKDKFLTFGLKEVWFLWGTMRQIKGMSTAFHPSGYDQESLREIARMSNCDIEIIGKKIDLYLNLTTDKFVSSKGWGLRWLVQKWDEIGNTPKKEPWEI